MPQLPPGITDLVARQIQALHQPAHMTNPGTPREWRENNGGSLPTERILDESGGYGDQEHWVLRRGNDVVGVVRYNPDTDTYTVHSDQPNLPIQFLTHEQNGNATARMNFGEGITLEHHPLIGPPSPPSREHHITLQENALNPIRVNITGHRNGTNVDLTQYHSRHLELDMGAGHVRFGENTENVALTPRDPRGGTTHITLPDMFIQNGWGHPTLAVMESRDANELPVAANFSFPGQNTITMKDSDVDGAIHQCNTTLHVQGTEGREHRSRSNIPCFGRPVIDRHGVVHQLNPNLLSTVQATISRWEEFERQRDREPEVEAPHVPGRQRAQGRTRD